MIKGYDYIIGMKIKKSENTLAQQKKFIENHSLDKIGMHVNHSPLKVNKPSWF